MSICDAQWSGVAEKRATVCLAQGVVSPGHVGGELHCKGRGLSISGVRQEEATGPTHVALCLPIHQPHQRGLCTRQPVPWICSLGLQAAWSCTARWPQLGPRSAGSRMGWRWKYLMPCNWVPRGPPAPSPCPTRSLRMLGSMCARPVMRRLPSMSAWLVGASGQPGEGWWSRHGLTPSFLSAEPPVQFLAPEAAPSPLCVAPGEPVVLSCELSRATAAVSWSHNGSPVQEGKGLKLQAEGPRRALCIQAAEPAHAGLYTCQCGMAPGAPSLSFTVQVAGE